MGEAGNNRSTAQNGSKGRTGGSRLRNFFSQKLNGKGGKNVTSSSSTPASQSTVSPALSSPSDKGSTANKQANNAKSSNNGTVEQQNSSSPSSSDVPRTRTPLEAVVTPPSQPAAPRDVSQTAAAETNAQPVQEDGDYFPSETHRNDVEMFEVEDGADGDASIRPITPSSIDAASSFTGSRSTSQHSLAPTSRTFKSFVTGHSKASASTKPPQINGNATLVADNMKDRTANRIATSVHESEEPAVTSSVASMTLPGAAVAEPATSSNNSAGSPSKPAVSNPSVASPLRNSFTGLSEGGFSDAPAAASLETPTAQNVPTQQEDSLKPSKPVLISSNSISFFALPPTSPSGSSFQHYSNNQLSAPGSPIMPSSGSVRSVAGVPGAQNLHYPHHSHHDPRNNPRASSPPPDNSSTLTLASSTGGGPPSIHGSSHRQAAPGVGGEGGGSGGGGSMGAPSYLERHRASANEDASIRAIAPSRRESGDSLNSRWSAAVLSNRERESQKDRESYHTTPQGRNEDGRDGWSHRGKTPSMRTMNTTASSYYYAAPVSQAA